jgi:hypothetical protein
VLKAFCEKWPARLANLGIDNALGRITLSIYREDVTCPHFPHTGSYDGLVLVVDLDL